MDSLVIGNGTSRLQFDLHKLSKHFVTYGCNAIYRDFMPDYLVSMDIYIVRDIIEDCIHRETKFYTQHVNEVDRLADLGEPIHFIQTLPSTPDSGTAALELASILNKSNTIYMIGFDYHSGSYNNVYSGSKHYHPKGYSVPLIQDDKWRNRMLSIVNKHKNIEFYRITDQEDNNNIPNYNTMNIQQFREKYNA